MKTSRIYLLVIAALLGCAVMFSSSLAQDKPAAAGGSRVAICDVAQVFDNYARAKELSSEFVERGKRLQAEDDQRVKAIEHLSNELEGLMVGSEEYQQRLEQVHQLTIKRKAWMDYQTDLARRDRLRLTKEMYDEIIAMVAKIAQQRGIEVVLYRKNEDRQAESMAQLLQQMELRKVIYSADNVDITDTVLLAVNTAYSAGKE